MTNTNLDLKEMGLTPMTSIEVIEVDGGQEADLWSETIDWLQ